MTDTDRGTGRTTRQMTEAPKGAVFVWCNDHLAYPRDLAHSLGRDDLRIISLDEMGRCHHLMGREIAGIVVDHAANPTSRQWAGYDMLRGQVRATHGQ